MRVFALTAFLFSLSVSTAAAGTLDEGLTKVGSIVGSGVELPGSSPSPAPELPAVSPEPKVVGSVVEEITREPAPGPRAPRSAEPPGGADPVAGGDVEAPAQEAVASNPAQTEAKPHRPDRAGSADGSANSGPGSVRAAMPAPSEEWLAHVWPAVPLGQVGSALTAQVAKLTPSLPAGLSAFTSPSLPPGSAPTDSLPTTTPSAPTVSPDSHSFLSPDSGGMSILLTMITVLATLVGLLALARLTYGEDFFSTRWLR